MPQTTYVHNLIITVRIDLNNMQILKNLVNGWIIS